LLLLPFPFPLSRLQDKDTLLGFNNQIQTSLTASVSLIGFLGQYALALAGAYAG
jgi:hypothetical protein